MIDLMDVEDAYKILDSNIAKFAEANGAKLDYTNERTYKDSVYDWYEDYVQAKYEGKYDEYIEVINNIMFEIMERLTWDDNNVICIPLNNSLDCGRFEGLEAGKVTPIAIVVYHEVTSTKGKPFFDVENETYSLKCPQEVIDILEESGFSLDAREHDIYVTTPFLAYRQPDL